MKHKHLLSCLLLVSSLTACGGNGGVITGGTPYKDGQAAAVNPELKQEKEGKVKTVKVTETMSFSMKVSSQGYNLSISEKLNGNLLVDLDEHTINGSFKLSLSTQGQSMSGTINISAAENDGRLVVSIDDSTSGSYISESQIETIYDAANYTIYSWNFTTESFGGLMEQLEAADLPTDINIEGYVRDIFNSIVIKGDASTGNFDIGLGKAINLEYQGVKVSLNSMKYSYKSCMLASANIGMSISGSSQGSSISGSVSTSANYSYTYRA